MGLWVLSCFSLFELAAASWIFGVFLSKLLLNENRQAAWEMSIGSLVG